jgi:hypothetical protein
MGCFFSFHPFYGIHIGMSEIPEQEPETTKNAPRKLAADTKPKRRRVIKPFEVVLIIGFFIIVFVLLKVLIGDIALKHEVSQGTTLSDKAVSAMEKQDTTSLRALGTKQFQADNTAVELSTKLTFQADKPITFAQMYGKDGKRSIDQQTAVNNSRGQHVVVIYRYSKLKVPFFVRIDTTKPPASDKWYLQSFSASTDETSLE